ncbi:DUF1512 family protein [bacterium]|nr:DUF1512 family protein [bacterium]
MMFGNDWLSTILGWLILLVFIFLYPKIMLSQILMKLEQSARNMEMLSKKARKVIMKKIGKSGKTLEQRLLDAQNFVVLEPSSLDPFGIVKKIDQIVRGMERKLDEIVNTLAGEKTKKEKREINYALRAAIGVHTIAKLVRHYVELVKKFKNFQLALLLQMQLPQIESIAKSELAGVEAFAKGIPIGDGIGPLVAASLMKGRVKKISEDVVGCERMLEGRRTIIIKASGPEPSLGRVDEAIAKIVKKYRVAKVITVDAALKLEGEKNGEVASGVGFAMGGYMRELIENILLPKKIPVEAIIVKVGAEESIMPMKEEIAKALPNVVERIRESIRKTKKKGIILVAGIGNSCGVGNNQRSAEESIALIKKLARKRKKEKK